MLDVTIAYTTPPTAPAWKRWLLFSPLARIVFFIVMLIGGVLLLDRGFHAIGINRNSPLLIRSVVECVERIVPALMAYVALVRLIERRALTEFDAARIAPHGLLGLAFGTVLFSAVVGVLALLGSYHVIGFNPHANWFDAFLTVGLGAGIGEEIMFRGALYRIVEEGLGTWGALIVSALAFGFIHASNPGATLWSSSAIAIEAGLLFGMLYHLTRSLPQCMGLHAAWNFCQGTVYGIPVSGTAPDGWLVSRRTGPDWLTGASFGAEASVVALALCLLCTLVLLTIALRKGTIVPPSWARKLPDDGSAWDRLARVR